MATISSIGLGAGIEAETIITQLVAAEKAPITKVESENTKLNTKLSTWGRVQSAFSALQDASNALTKSTFWTATTATSSDDKSVTVTTSSSSKAGSYSVAVDSLAKAQYVTGPAMSANDAVVGEGTLRIELGTFTPNPSAPPAATFAAKTAATAVDIAIGPGDNTLEKIRDKINASNAGVTASLVKDSTGVRLVLRGATGAENGFKVSVTDADGGNTDATGLSALAFDPSADVKNMTESQAATNAKAKINGVEVTSTSNTFSDVLDGLTIQVSKTTTAPVDVNIAQDTGSIKTGIDNFVKAYNDVVGLIRVQTLYDAESKTAGTLQGDSTATGLLSQLRNLAGSNVQMADAVGATPAVFKQLSAIGLTMSKEGTLSTNSTKLSEAMKDLPGLQKFFANTDESNPSKVGIAERFRKLASQVTDSEGAIGSRKAGIQGTIKRNDDKIERMEDRLLMVEERLRKQYTALDNSMAGLNSLSNFVSAQLSALTRSSG